MNPTHLKFNRAQLMTEIHQHLGDVEIAVEVGTWRGDFAKEMCRRLQPEKFYAVDPFLLYEEYTDKPNPSEFANQDNLDKLADKVAPLISGLLKEGYSKLLRAKSQDAVKQFADNSIDVVYVDADHKFDPVLADITAWYQKVKPGGVLCGDDYIAGSRIEKFQVIEAVEHFAKQHDMPYAVTSGHNPSWVFFKQADNPFVQ